MYLFTKLCQYFFFLHTFVRPFNTNITNTIMQNNYGHFIQYCEWPPLEKVHDPKNLFSSVSKSKIDLSYCIVFWVLPEHTVQYDMIKKKKRMPYRKFFLSLLSTTNKNFTCSEQKLKLQYCGWGTTLLLYLLNRQFYIILFLTKINKLMRSQSYSHNFLATFFTQHNT
jgi:hypothetical protein